jgi:hypothetical protein
MQSKEIWYRLTIYDRMGNIDGKDNVDMNWMFSKGVDGLFLTDRTAQPL